MKQKLTSLLALLLVGAASMMTAGAQTKPTLAVFVVGGDNALVTPLTTAMGTNLTSGGRYTLTTSASTGSKLTELQATYAAGGGSSIDRNALAAWGRANSISAICLVVDDKKGNDHMFYAHLIDTKDSKVNGRGSYIRTGIAAGDLPRVALALSKQLEEPRRKRSTDTPARNYPAELDIEMVFVEVGTFEMGCQDDACQTNELPVHTVRLTKNFYMGKFQITRAQWKAAMAGHPTLANAGKITYDDQLPIENARWEEIDTAFLPRLNALTGKNYRLPTEAEWEYAARGGKHKSTYKFCGSDDIDEVAWYQGNNPSNKTYPVGSKKPNALGLYDMSGNTWDFCSDWYDPDYYKTIASGATDPKGPNAGVSHVVRGGNWGNPIQYVRVASRLYQLTNTAGYVGLRVVLDAQ
ncbi:MAG: formylglycine-generating enzyme family protein [Prevotellaceae bacterium]|jgi:formylglycine-generating enzyme required for sulfatase activity|nr:formylglycine-generating enzyme family protein [Prevotellaceae bacterium]